MLVGGAAVVGDDCNDCVVVGQRDDAADHAIDGGVGLGHARLAARQGVRVGPAALVGLRQEEVAGVIRGVGFDEQHIPVVALRQVIGHIGQPLMVEVQQLEIGRVIDYAQSVSPWILQEITDVLIDLLRYFLRLRVAGRRPDLRHKELEDIACCAQADKLHAHVAVECLAVNLKAVFPPLGPLAHG